LAVPQGALSFSPWHNNQDHAQFSCESSDLVKKSESLMQDVTEVCVNLNREQSWESIAIFQKKVLVSMCAVLSVKHFAVRRNCLIHNE
jgi:hypothetical protein